MEKLKAPNLRMQIRYLRFYNKHCCCWKCKCDLRDGLEIFVHINTHSDNPDIKQEFEKWMIVNRK